MHPVAKVGIGTLTIGTIAGTAYAGSYYLGRSNETGMPMTQLIDSRYEYKLLDIEGGKLGPDGFKWKGKWDNYKRDNASNGKGEDTFKLDGWVKGFEGDLTEQLIEKCKILSNSKEDRNNPNLYSDLTKYCGRGVTIEEQIAKDNLIIVDPNKDDPFWTEKEKKLGELTKYLSNLGFNEIDKGSINLDMVKSSCRDYAKKTKQESNYTNIYSSFKEICAKPKTETNS